MPLGLSAPHNERRLWRSHYVGALRGDDRGGHRHHEALGGGAQGLHATANEADHPYAEAYPQIHPSGLLFVSVQIPQCSQHRAMLCMLCSALLCLSLLCLWLFGLITLLCLFVVEAWIRTSLANYGLQLEDFHLFVSDGASNGTKALYPCALHTIFRCPHHTPLAMAVRCARPHCHSPCLASPLTPVAVVVRLRRSARTPRSRPSSARTRTSRLEFTCRRKRPRHSNRSRSPVAYPQGAHHMRSFAHS